MSLTITIPGAVNATTGATAPATLTIGVGVPGATGPQGPAGVGVPTGGTAGQFLTKIDGTNYNTDWTTVNFSQYLTTSAAAATYQPLSGMSSYLTTASAASTYQPLSGMSSYLTTSSAASTYAPLARGLPASGTVGQVLTKVNGTDYNASWQTLVPGDRYLSSSTTSLTISTGAKTLTIGTGLSYSSQQDIVIAYDAANHMHAVVTSYDSSTGALVVDVQNKTGSGTYSLWTVNVGGTVPLQSVNWGEIVGTLGNQSDLATALNAKLSTATAASTYAPLASPTFTGTVTIPAGASISGYATTSSLSSYAPLASPALTGTPTAPTALTADNSTTIATTAFVKAQGYLTSAPVTSVAGRTGAVTLAVADVSGAAPLASPTFTGTVTIPAGASITGYAALAGATFTGLVNTAASTTAGAGFRLPHGTAPTTPTDGDVWTTTGNLWVRISGASQAVALQGSSAQLSSNNIFTNASSTYGNSTAAGTINLGTGATISGATKAINIGTNGVAGSTTNIAIGSTTGTSTTTLQGTTNAVTAAQNTNTTQVATTAFVLGQASSTTPVVNGTAAVGTATTFARADHVHPTDTSRAALASPTFTGTPAAPTAAVDTNTTQIATTAYVVGQGYAKLASPTLTGTPAAPTAAVDTNTTQIATTAYVVGQGYLKSATASSTYAPLASPALTGTPTAPTATAGTNTTQVATTAFVTNAVPVQATVAQAYAGTSSTTILSPLLAPLAFASGGYFPRMTFANATSGTGASVGGADYRYEIVGPNTLTAGYAAIYSEIYQLWSSGTTFTKLNFTKPIWFTFRICNFSSTYDGDANTEIKVALGNLGTDGNDPTSPAIGIFKLGGASSFINLMVHNGTTLTKVATTTTFNTTVLDIAIYSNNGTVTLYINGVQAATTTSGPTADSNNTRVNAAVKTGATAAVRQLLEINNIKVYAPQ